MKIFIKWIAKKITKIVALIFVLLDYIKIYSFPDGLSIFRGGDKALNLLITNYTDICTTRYIKNGAKNKLIDEDSRLWKDPFLRFQAIWSIGSGSINTPCPLMLANDLASIVDLKGKKILCIGSKNHFETNLLVMRGANRKLVTNIDLYSNIPGILQMDFHHLEFEDGMFDIIFWAGSFAYASDLQQAASQAVRVVKKQGIIAVGDILSGGTARELLIEIKPEIKSVIDMVSPEIKVFNKRIGTVEQMAHYFSDGASATANVLLTRKYLPNHANVILKIEQK
jgi:SAM-dependent methyltransferase